MSSNRLIIALSALRRLYTHRSNRSEVTLVGVDVCLKLACKAAEPAGLALGLGCAELLVAIGDRLPRGKQSGEFAAFQHGVFIVFPPKAGI